MDTLIKTCLDLDEWQHSLQNKLETVKDYEVAEDILLAKIRHRTEEIEMLNRALRQIYQESAAQLAY